MGNAYGVESEEKTMVRITLSQNLDFQNFDFGVKYVGNVFKVIDLKNGGKVKEILIAKTGETYEFYRSHGKLTWHLITA